MSEDKLYGTAAASGLPVNQIRHIQERIIVVDEHHELGEAMAKYGPVFHKTKSFDGNSWEMVTEVALKMENDGYDPSSVKYLAERIDWLTRGPGSTSVELVARIKTSVTNSPERAPEMSEQEGVGRED